MFGYFKGLKFIHIAVFICGMSGLAIEMATLRLLAPFFGTQQLVTTNVIGIVLIALSAGYYVGGKYADRHPDEQHFYQIIFIAGLLTGIIPVASQPVFWYSVEAIKSFSLGSIVLSFIAILIIIATPVFFLGFISPFAIRIETKKVKKSGQISGRIYSLSTIGSILGTYIPSFLTIPFIGVRLTIYIFSILILIIAVIGLRKHIFGKLNSLKMLYVVLTAIIIVLALLPQGLISPKPNTVFECESTYNYIRVYREGDTTYLELNEGIGVQSVYIGDNELSGMIWDYFLTCPNFNEDTEDVAILGLAAGTSVGYYYKFYPDVKIDGVEIDGKVIEVGRKYFNMTYDTLNAIEMDGRMFVKTTDEKYDVVIVDAYGHTYIPFHMATKEFFTEVRDILESDGVMAINIADRPGSDNRLRDVIGNTILEVFPEVYLIPVGKNILEVSNWLLIAPKNSMDLNQIKANFSRSKNAVDSMNITPSSDVQKYKDMLDNSSIRISRFLPKEDMVFTDDKAPIEIMRGIMLFQSPD
jgi:spermidine synthase